MNNLVEITLRVDAETLSAIAALLNKKPVVEAEKPVVEAAPAEPAVEETKPKPRPSRKKAVKTAPVKEAEPEVKEPEPEPEVKEAEPEVKEAEPETKNDLTYDTHVKPWLVKLASHANDGREAALAIVKVFGVRNAKDIPADKFAEVIASAKAKIAELDEGEDDVTFE